jgi:hypothetical protein
MLIHSRLKIITEGDKGFLMSKQNKADNKGDPGAAGSQCQTQAWPPRPDKFGELLNPIEAAQYLRLDETSSHTPQSAIRTLNHWRQKGQLKATKFARHVWYRKTELDRFLAVKTEP